MPLLGQSAIFDFNFMSRWGSSIIGEGGWSGDFWGQSSSQDMRHQCWDAAERLRWQSHKYQKNNLAPGPSRASDRLNNGTSANQVTQTETCSSHTGLLSTE